MCLRLFLLCVLAIGLAAFGGEEPDLKQLTGQIAGNAEGAVSRQFDLGMIYNMDVAGTAALVLPEDFVLANARIEKNSISVGTPSAEGKKGGILLAQEQGGETKTVQPSLAPSQATHLRADHPFVVQFLRVFDPERSCRSSSTAKTCRRM